jgi:hypothetical protein
MLRWMTCTETINTRPCEEVTGPINDARPNTMRPFAFTLRSDWSPESRAERGQRATAGAVDP